MLTGSLIGALLSIIKHCFLNLSLVVSKIQNLSYILQFCGHLLIKLLEFSFLIEAKSHTSFRLDRHRCYCYCSEPFVVDYTHQRVSQPIVRVEIRGHEQGIEENIRSPEFPCKLLSHLRFSKRWKPSVLFFPLLEMFLTNPIGPLAISAKLQEHTWYFIHKRVTSQRSIEIFAFTVKKHGMLGLKKLCWAEFLLICW